MIGFHAVQPHLLPGCVAHWSARYGVLNSGGTNATNGQSVATWRDQSGNGRHLVTGTNPVPTFVTSSTINSRPALRFNGSQELKLAAMTGWPSGDCTVIVISSTVDTGNLTSLFANTGSNWGTGNRFSLHHPWSGTIYWDHGQLDIGGRISTSYPVGSNTPLLATFGVNGSNMSIHNKTSVLASQTSSKSFTAQTEAFSVGGSAVSTGHTGDIAEIAIFSRWLNGEERTQAVNALLATYAF